MKLLKITLFAYLAALLAGCFPGSLNGNPEMPAGVEVTLPDSRTAYLGFMPQLSPRSAVSVPLLYNTIEKHSDIIAHQLDHGVPWEEAYNGQYIYHANVEQDLTIRLTYREERQKLFLSLSPLNRERSDLAGFWGEDSQMPLSGAWRNRAFDDAQVIEAYLNYCRDMIRRFQPDYLAYALEVNELAEADPAKFDRFLTFLNQVYQRLKIDNPKLPLFVTVTLGDAQNMHRLQGTLAQLQPYTDYLAVSTYPFLSETVAGEANQIPRDWFTKLRDIVPKKPMVIAETGFNAENLNLPAAGRLVPGNEISQASYTQFLLSEAEQLEAEFVIWGAPFDYDPPWERPADATTDPWYQRWQYTGFFTESMQARPALRIWDMWLALPKR